MKLTYKVQIIASVVVILLANVLSTIATHWVYRSAGFVICGLLWIIHPVFPKDTEVSKKTFLWMRIAGLILILIGVFTRVYIY